MELMRRQRLCLERSARVPELPAGTVTLLFTDIEGSTRLLQEVGPHYADILAEHRRLVRAALDAHSGQEVDTQGDAFFAAFTRAGDALAAAIQAQRALAAQRWPRDVTVRVRMGLHSGSPLPTEGGYVGLDVHRAARVGAAAHGGQILLSLAAAELVRDDLPAGASLRDLGEHQLKDLQRPERLFQLVLPDLPADFPPPRTIERRGPALPVPPTALLGREHEVAAVRALLLGEGVRLVTLTGPGGIGKTRLGLQVAAELSEHFGDGVFFVSLAPISDPALVAPTIARALNLREIERGTRPPEEILEAYLAGKRVLLLLDNFEQVTAAAPLVADLLAQCPGLSALVTSREPLHLRGEREYPLPPLALPSTPADATTLARYPATALFLERALAVKPDFTIADTTAAAIAEICARLDGLPLAIELAAARVKHLSPEALVARLSSRLGLLTAGPRDLPDRQRTLRDAIAWSYDLLAPAEQMLFRRLAVFAGGCTLEAAEAICPAGGGLEIDVLEGLASLTDKSLVREADTGVEHEPRYTMLETIREFSLEQLAASGEADALRRAHADYFLDLAQRAEPFLTGAQQGLWLERLDREHGNLRLALAWARDSGASALGLRLAAAIWRFWYTRGDLSEGRGWLEELLARTAAPEAGALQLQSIRARALVGAATLSSIQFDPDRATMQGEESLRLGRELGDKAVMADALNVLGLLALHRGDVARAAALCAEGLALDRELGDPWATARALLSLGQSAYAQANYAHAGALFTEGLALMRQAGSISHSATALLYLGHVAREQGDLARAARNYRESLAMSQGLGDKLRMARGLEGLATLGGVQGHAAHAARLLGAAAAVRETLGASVHPLDRTAIDRATTALRAQLGAEAFAAAWEAGHALELDEAFYEALGEAS